MSGMSRSSTGLITYEKTASGGGRRRRCRGSFRRQSDDLDRRRCRPRRFGAVEQPCRAAHEKRKRKYDERATSVERGPTGVIEG